MIDQTMLKEIDNVVVLSNHRLNTVVGDDGDEYAILINDIRDKDSLKNTSKSFQSLEMDVGTTDSLRNTAKTQPLLETQDSIQELKHCETTRRSKRSFLSSLFSSHKRSPSPRSLKEGFSLTSIVKKKPVIPRRRSYNKKRQGFSTASLELNLHNSCSSSSSSKSRPRPVRQPSSTSFTSAAEVLDAVTSAAEALDAAMEIVGDAFWPEGSPGKR